MEIRVMTIEDYPRVYALWMSIHGFGMRSHINIIAAFHPSCLRADAVLQHADKFFTAVVLFVCRTELLLGSAALQVMFGLDESTGLELVPVFP